MSTILVDGRKKGNRKARIEFLELNKNAVLICESSKEREELKTKYPQLADRFVLWCEVNKKEEGDR